MLRSFSGTNSWLSMSCWFVCQCKFTQISNFLNLLYTCQSYQIWFQHCWIVFHYKHQQLIQPFLGLQLCFFNESSQALVFLLVMFLSLIYVSNFLVLIHNLFHQILESMNFFTLIDKSSSLSCSKLFNQLIHW